MKNIPPPIKPGVTTDEQCGTNPNICGSPNIIENQNLVRSDGGTPGFLTISRHTCVGDSIESGEFTKDKYGSVLGKTVLRDNGTTTPRSEYPYACGYFDYARTATGSSVTSSTASSLWRAGVGACSQWFDFFCHIFYGCFKDNDPKNAYKRNNMSETMIKSYLTNPSQPKRKRLLSNTNPYNSERVSVKFQNIVPIIKGTARSSSPTIEDVYVHSIVRHPRMNREELRFFGVNESDFDKVLVAAPGTTIDINYSCIHSEAMTVSIAFFKWDLSTIVEHNGRVFIDGRQRDLYKILSERTGNNEMHNTDSVMRYILHSGWFRNGANKGNTGQSYSGKVTLPLEPFYSDNTIMVVFIGNRFPSLGKYSNSRKVYDVSINSDPVTLDNPNTWDSALPFRNTKFGSSNMPWSNSAGGDNVHCGCSLSITTPEYTEEGIGCSQTRNVDWPLYSNPDGTNFRQAKPTTGTNVDQNWKSTSQGSHTIKIVSKDYYVRDCTYRTSEEVESNSDLLQNSVVYASGCFESVGDPYINSSSLLGKESRLGMYLAEKCNSYSMNISPNAEISNVSRCCIPKITGPFVLEPVPYLGRVETVEDLKPFKNDILYDGPDIKTNYRPNLNYYSENLSYHLDHRIDCECNSPECARSKCYSCPSNTKTEYEACLASDLCGKGNKADCCIDPCIGAPKDYGACVRANGGLYNKKGCCLPCEDCVANTVQEYQQCLNNEGTFATKKCNERGCCNLNCEGCPRDIVSCDAIPACAGCCQFICDANCNLKDEYGPQGHPKLKALRDADGIDAWPPVYVNKSLTDYWNCIQSKANYSSYPKNKCVDNCCCANPCDKYRIEGMLPIDSPNGPRSYTRDDCKADPMCMAEGCLTFIPFNRYTG